MCVCVCLCLSVCLCVSQQQLFATNKYECYWKKYCKLYILIKTISFILFTDSTTPPLQEIQCYIHGLSPVKSASNSERMYFNCTLQCKEGTRQAVCFSQQKHPEMKTFQTTKCAVKIFDLYNVKNKWHNIEQPIQDYSKRRNPNIWILRGCDSQWCGRQHFCTK